MIKNCEAVPKNDEQSAPISFCRSAIFSVSALLYFTNTAENRHQSMIHLLTAICNAAAEYVRPLHDDIPRDSLDVVENFKFDELLDRKSVV